MASVNKVIIMGRLGADPELRYTQNQTAVATLSVATSDFRTGQDGQRQEFTEWHKVVVWSKQAENCNRYLSKGRGVFVEGRLQTRSWEDQNGQKRYSTEIVAQNVQFLPGSAGQGQGQGQYQQGQQGGGQYQDPMGGGGSPGGGMPMGGGAGMQDNGGGFPQAPQGDNGGGPGAAVMDDIPF